MTDLPTTDSPLEQPDDGTRPRAVRIVSATERAIEARQVLELRRRIRADIYREADTADQMAREILRRGDL